MLRNYFITALRNLWRSKGSTLINLSGLTLGVTTSLILFLLVRYESGFDNFHAKRDRIYRAVSSSDGNQGRNYSAGVPSVFPDAFKIDFPEAEEVIFTYYRESAVIAIPQKFGEAKKFEEKKGVVYTQSNYFKIFDRRILAGNADRGLDEPNEAILSKKSAIKYFGNEDALGEVLNFDHKTFKVTAIMEDSPANTDLPFEVMLSYITIKKDVDETGGWHHVGSNEQCYLLLKQGASAAELQRRMPGFVKKYRGQNPYHENYELQPLSTIHFDDRYGNYNDSTISKQMLAALSVVGIFLIISACINFINLVTAESIKRSKEVGIRKALGSSRRQLVAQFLGESGLVTVLAVLLAVGLAQLGLGLLDPFLDLSLAINLLSDKGLWLFLLSVTAFVGILSGVYPSLIVSGFKPVFAIKAGTGDKNSSGYQLRRGLVVLQLFISQFFIIGTIVLIHQMNYFRNKDLGFRRGAIVNIPIPEKEAPESHGTGSGSTGKMRTLRDEVSRLRGIESSSINSAPPSSGNVQSTDFTIEGKEDSYGTQVKQVDGTYLGLFDLKLVAGINVLDLDTASGCLVNEKLAAMVGYNNPQEIIGKNIKTGKKILPVIGVIKDFHTVSLREPIEATTMFNGIRGYRNLSLKVNPADLQETIRQVQQKWEAAYPEFIFSYQFLDDQIKEFYEREQKMSVMLTLFTSIAIFIGCLGLFGLATFMANQKTKEIGVRKVLGASVRSIVMLFSKEYVTLILIGFALAAPSAWYVMNQWLSDFAYKINIGPAVFLIGLAVTFLIAMITVGYRSLRAATANPVESLRSE
jgi:putative ABC transport system permease protein